MEKETLSKGLGVVMLGAGVGMALMFIVKGPSSSPEPIPEYLAALRDDSDSEPVLSAENEEPPLSLTQSEPPEQVSPHPLPTLVEAERERIPLTAEMQEWTEGIESGRRIAVSVQGQDHEYLFRPLDVTADSFRISTGVNSELPVEYRVYEGRELLEGQLGEGRASLAVVHDTYSVALSTEQGDFLIEEDPETGDMVAVVLGKAGMEDHLCFVNNGQSAIRAPEVDDGTRERIPVSLVLSDAVAGEPGSAGDNWVDHPYYRLGPLYDASLRDMPVLWGSAKSQTGSSSGLSSRAASYLTYAARVRDTYERQLGFRMMLMELILIPSDSSEGDLGDDLSQWSSWLSSNRPQSDYPWGHAALWTLVDGSGGGVIGRAYVDRYGSSSLGISVQERNYDWDVMNHEMGHNVGASHTSGGVMNPSLRNNDEDFFKQSENGEYTGAMDIYNHMAFNSSALSKLYGPADLRHPEEMPFAITDEVSTPLDTPLTFDPMENDLHTVPYGQQNVLRLLEVGTVYPASAGTAEVDGALLTFTPSPGFTGNAWFTYTIQGSIGNGGQGWLHAADVIVSVGGSSADPTLAPSLSLQDDVIAATLQDPVRFNPLLNDEGEGRLWAGNVDVVLGPGDTSPESYSDAAFQITGVTIVTGTGGVSLESIQVVDGSASGSTGYTGYVVYTPGVGEGNQVHLTYDVMDADGNTATANVYLNRSYTLSATSSVSYLVETEGRVATFTISRPGAAGTAADETVYFALSGNATFSGTDADAVLTGYSQFHPPTQTGTVVIPAGQLSTEITVWARPDALAEGTEMLNLLLYGSDNLLTDPTAVVPLEIRDVGPITTFLLNEDFDGFAGSPNGSWNGWSNPSDDDMDWTLNSGTTGSSNTGPNGDNTSGSGQYFYTEASGNSNKTAHLLSPTLDVSSAPRLQLEFAYHMLGSNMGDLHLDIFANGSWNLDVIPAFSGEQSSDADDWKTALVDLNAYRASDFRIRFRGETGSSFRSDICIDDVKVGYSADPSPLALMIEGQPASQTIDVLQPLYLAVTVESYPQPTFQWKKDGAVIPGATEAFYHVPVTVPGDAGSYTCDVTQGSTVSSTAGVITINGLAEAPMITSHPVDQTADEGDDNILFSVTATGIPAPTYQWRRNGSILNGQTGSTLELDNVTPANSGSYTVDVINPVATVTSNPASFTVNGRPTASIVPRLYTAVGDLLLLNGTATDDGPLTVSWTKQSGPGTVTFGDSTQASTTAEFDQEGTYVLRLQVQDGVFTVSDTVEVLVYESGLTVVELSPVHDGYVRGDSNADRVYNNSDLEVREPSSVNSNTRRSYLRFDLSGISGTIVDADLQLYLRVYRSGTTHRLHAVSDDTWQESTLTFNNAPAQGTILDSWSPTRVDYYWASATSQVQTEVDGDGEISLGLSVSSDRQNEYSSSENGTTAQRPKLIVVYQEFTNPQVSVSSSGTGNEATSSPVQFTLTRSLFLSQSFTLNFSLSGSSVDADYTVSGADSYSAGTGTVSFAADETEKVITVTPVDDSLTEGTETVSLTIDAGTGYEAVAPLSAQGDLLDAQTNYPPVLTLVWPSSGTTVGSGTGISHWLEVSGTDDGFGGSALSYTWSKVSGPGTVTFDQAGSAGTRVTVSANGSYVLRCSVSDGNHTVSEDVTLESGVGSAPSSGLLVHYAMDEAAGAGTAADSSGNGRTGAVGSAVVFNQGVGQEGGSAEFSNNSNAQIEDADAENYLNGLSAITVSTWVKSDSDDTDSGWLNARTPAGGGDPLQFRYDRAAFKASGISRNMQFQLWTSGGNMIYETAGNVQTTDWQHVVLTWQSGELPKVYLDGVLDTPSWAGTSDVQGQTATGTVDSIETLLVGRSAKDNNGSWDGRLDELRIYNLALSQAEVVQLFNGSAANTVPEASLTANSTVDVGVVLNLDGAGADAETSSASLGYQWKTLSGPGIATFGDDTAEDTTVQFDTPGIYELALVVNDGEMADGEILTVTVTGGVVDNNSNDVPDSWEAVHEDSSMPGTVQLADGNNYDIRDVYFWGLDSGSAAPLQAESLTTTPGAFTFQFYGVSGVTYRVRRTTDLTNASGWTDVTGYESVAGGDANIPVTDSSPPANSIYRVEVIEP